MKNKILIVCVCLFIGIRVFGQEPIEIQPDQYVKKDVSCKGGNDGSIILNVDKLGCSTPFELVGCKPQTITAPSCSSCLTYATGSYLNVISATCITNTFTGNADVNGGTLTICGTVSLNSISVNSGKVIILGNVTCTNFNINNTGASVEIYGSLNTNSIASNGIIKNYGTINVSNGFVENNTSVIDNFGTISINGQFTINNVFNNSGPITVTNGECIINATGKLTNNCKISLPTNFTINGQVVNKGDIIVAGRTYLNSSAIVQLDQMSLFNVNTISIDGKVSGPTTGCGTFQIKQLVSTNTSASLSGHISICGIALASIPVSIRTADVSSCQTSCRPTTIPPSIVWSNNTTGPELKNVTAGLYSFTMTCGLISRIGKIYIAEPAQILSTQITSKDVSVVNTCDGEVKTVVFGGTDPFTYSWSNLSSSSNLTQLCAGTYTLTVVDSKLCKSISSVTIKNADKTDICWESKTTNACNAQKGSINLLFKNCATPPTTTLCVAIPTPPSNVSAGITATASGSNYTVSSGKVLIPNGYSGNITIEGGEIVIDGTVNIGSLSLNNSAVRAVILPTANVTVQNINLNSSSSEIINYGTISVPSLSINGLFTNNGTINVQGDFNVNNTSNKVTNNGTLNVGQSIQLNGLLFENNSSLIIGNNLTLIANNGSTLVNNCTLKSLNTGQLIINSNLVNNGTLSWNGSFTLNSQGNVTLGDASSFETGNVILNGKIYGPSSNCALFKLSGSVLTNSGSSLSGNINVCGNRLSSFINTTISSTVIENCTCSSKTTTSVTSALVPTSVNWSNRQTGSDIKDLTAGTYTFVASFNDKYINGSVTITNECSLDPEKTDYPQIYSQSAYGPTTKNEPNGGVIVIVLYKGQYFRFDISGYETGTYDKDIPFVIDGYTFKLHVSFVVPPSTKTPFVPDIIPTTVAINPPVGGNPAGTITITPPSGSTVINIGTGSKGTGTVTTQTNSGQTISTLVKQKITGDPKKAPDEYVVSTMPSRVPTLVLISQPASGTVTLSTTQNDPTTKWYDAKGNILYTGPSFSTPHPELIRSVSVGIETIPVFAYPIVTPSNKNNPICCGGTETKVPDSVIDDCKSDLFAMAIQDVKTMKEAYFKLAKMNFEKRYKDTLMVYIGDKMSMSHKESEYSYTLYNYDQAGNLIKTVPPQGVDLASKNHTMTTDYIYNALNKVAFQKLPDQSSVFSYNNNAASFSQRFWYDDLGRIVASQSARQYPNNYSFSQYDNLGRVVLSGQFKNTSSLITKYGDKSILDINSQDYKDWLNNAATYRDIVLTVYDDSVAHTYLSSKGLHQKNLRNRISSVFFYQDAYTPTFVGNYNSATHYSYDIHGNVSAVYQENKDLADLMQDIKIIKYEYDLISNKVNKIIYQEGFPDQFFHKYVYDGENRIDSVFVSRDNVIWDKDVNYDYYRHGPLARVEYGEQQVQAIDYAYTLQGWIKGINSNTLVENRDMGKDSPTTNGFSPDIFGFSLSYFNGDYKPIVTLQNNFLASNEEILKPNSDLYNGNITGSVYAVKQFMQGTNPSLFTSRYSYDQLNRLVADTMYKSTNVVSSNSWTGAIKQKDYAMSLKYDKNGNITNLYRDGVKTASSTLKMDSLFYLYTPGTNKLSEVNDKSDGLETYTDDFTGTHSYTYDADGNLSSDLAEKIKKIAWNPRGKIDTIYKTDNSIICFKYDPLGNRIAKIVRTNGNSTTVKDVETYYVYDPRGMQIASYNKHYFVDKTGNFNTLFTLNEHYLYGAKRYGSDLESIDLVSKVGNNLPIVIPIENFNNYGTHYSHQVGNRSYEAEDHLGNVVATFSDKRMSFISSTTPSLLSYSANITSANLFYPFGMQMPGLKYNSINYRFGFNGKEKDDEIKGKGNSYDFGARIYDSRLGIWLSVDPLFDKFSYINPYNFDLNNPVLYIDKNGKAPSQAFNTPEDAAADFGFYINKISIDKKIEYASLIYEIKVNDVIKYTYNNPKGYARDEAEPYPLEKGQKAVADVHTHANYSANDEHVKRDNEFGGIHMDNTEIYRNPSELLSNLEYGDIRVYNRDKVDGYVVTPNGSLQKYDHINGSICVIRTDMPKDPKDPSKPETAGSCLDAKSKNESLRVIESLSKSDPFKTPPAPVDF